MKKDFLIFDVETSDLYNKKLPAYHKDQAWIVQIAGVFTDSSLVEKGKFSLILNPPHKEAKMSEGALSTHGISMNRCKTEGISQWKVHDVIKPVFFDRIRLVGHNLSFDSQFLHRFAKSKEEHKSLVTAFQTGICTMRGSIDFCKLPPTKSMLKAQAEGKKKWKNWHPIKYKAPKLEELYEILFNEKMKGAHDAFVDVKATLKSLRELVHLGVIKL